MNTPHKIIQIAIDARFYGPEQGGIGRYLQELLSSLEALNPPAYFKVLLRRSNWNQYQPRNPHFTKILADIPWYGWAEQISLARILKNQRLDLVHFPHWNIPLLYRGAFVVTIHDLLLLHYPTTKASTLGPLSYWAKYQAYRFVLGHAARRARHILADSNFTKQDIIKTLRVPAKKISVAYPVPAANVKNAQNSSAKERELLSKRYGITKPYTLYVGVAFPHKNLPRLLAAWEQVASKNNHTRQLVLVGKKNYFYEELLRGPLHKMAGSVIYTDFVTDSELPVLYRNAELYVFPSLYEGFGLPPLEALQYGVPVVSSNQTALPEVLQNAALYVDPQNTTALAEAIERGLNDQKLRQKLVAAGHTVYPQYQGVGLAKKAWEIYQNSVY